MQAPPDQAARPALSLVSRLPTWSADLRCWILNFRGRVRAPSTKNFQLVSADDPAGPVLLQFGKLEEDLFILDFNPTRISAAQAFAIGLTAFDRKPLL